MTLRETVDKSDNSSIATLIMADHVDRNFLIDTIEPLYTASVLTGSPLQTYNAKIIYVGISLEMSGFPGVVVAGPVATFYNELNAAFFLACRSSLNFNTVTGVANYDISKVDVANIFFNRVIFSGLDHIKFIGYKITLT